MTLYVILDYYGPSCNIVVTMSRQCVHRAHFQPQTPLSLLKIIIERFQKNFSVPSFPPCCWADWSHLFLEKPYLVHS